MRSPYSNNNLSARARGVYATYVEYGRILTPEEAETVFPEGRDAIRAAKRELKIAGYIKAVRVNVNGNWRTVEKFVDPTIQLTLEDGFSGALSPSNTSTSDESTNSLNKFKFTNVNLNLRAAPVKEGGNEMGWPGFDEGTKPSAKKRIAQEVEATPGSVGKLDDRQKRLNDKYKKTKFEAMPEHMRRAERPEEEWTTSDLVAEFYDLARKAAPGAPGQINGKRLATWINRQVGEGVERIYMLKAMRMFFDDPRLIANPGIGEPLWIKFFAYYPTVHGIVSRVAETNYEDQDLLAHQERMLKLLEG